MRSSSRVYRLICGPRSLRAASHAPVCTLTLLLGGCHIDVTGIPVANDASMVDAATLADASSDLPPDASDAADDAGASKHPSCDVPLPDPLPPLPRIATLPSGRPEFDMWRDLTCEDVQAQAACADDVSAAPHLCQRCFGAEADQVASGVCVPFGSTGCIATGHAHDCVACVPPRVKARACCLGLDVDCRRWPFEGSSHVGELCANHADCEAGLVCTLAGTDESRFAVCACPQASGDASISINLCLPEHVP